jgi:hypothetical protein
MLTYVVIACMLGEDSLDLRHQILRAHAREDFVT